MKPNAGKMPEKEPNSIQQMDELLNYIRTANPQLTEEMIAKSVGYRAGYIGQSRSKGNVTLKFINALRELSESYKPTPEEIKPRDLLTVDSKPRNMVVPAESKSQTPLVSDSKPRDLMHAEIKSRDPLPDLFFQMAASFDKIAEANLTNARSIERLVALIETGLQEHR